MPKDHRPSVKDDEQYEKLRERGESKEKAARIANTTRSGAARRGGKSGPPGTPLSQYPIAAAKPRSRTVFPLLAHDCCFASLLFSRRQ